MKTILDNLTLSDLARIGASKAINDEPRPALYYIRCLADRTKEVGALGVILKDRLLFSSEAIFLLVKMYSENLALKEDSLSEDQRKLLGEFPSLFFYDRTGVDNNKYKVNNLPNDNYKYSLLS